MRKSLKKTIINRALLGFPLGIAIGQLMAIIISLIMEDGIFVPVPYLLIERFGNEINAVIIQTILTALIGVTFASSSVIWEIDEWSLAKQSGIYFSITAIVFLPISYFLGWMQPSLTGFISYLTVFVCVFIINWIVGYFVWKKTIDAINRKINE